MLAENKCGGSISFGDFVCHRHVWKEKKRKKFVEKEKMKKKCEKYEKRVEKM